MLIKNGNGNGIIDPTKDDRVSFHHWVKRALLVGFPNIVNNFRVILCWKHHEGVERNISRGEAIILRQFLGFYVEVGTSYINNGGKDLTDAELSEIIHKEFMKLRKIPRQTMLEKLKSRPNDIIERVRNMVREKLGR